MTSVSQPISLSGVSDGHDRAVVDPDPRHRRPLADPSPKPPCTLRERHRRVVGVRLRIAREPQPPPQCRRYASEARALPPRPGRRSPRRPRSSARSTRAFAARTCAPRCARRRGRRSPCSRSPDRSRLRGPRTARCRTGPGPSGHAWPGVGRRDRPHARWSRSPAGHARERRRRSIRALQGDTRRCSRRCRPR